MPWKPTDDPGWLRDKVWTPEQNAMAQACEACESFAEVLVLILTRFGLEGTAGFLREVKCDRQRLRQVARDLHRVGGFDVLADLVEVAGTMKPKPPPTWHQRQRKRMAARVKELRAKGWPHFR
jgi:hypothetical protein